VGSTLVAMATTFGLDAEIYSPTGLSNSTVYLFYKLVVCLHTITLYT